MFPAVALLVLLLLQSLIFFCCEQQPKLPYDEQLSGTYLIRSEKLCWTLGLCWSLSCICENLCSSIVLSGLWSGAVRRRSDLCYTGNIVVDPSSVCKTSPSILLLSCHMWGPWTPQWKPRPSLAPRSALLASRRTKGWRYRCVNRSQTHLDAAFTLKMSALREHHQHWNGPDHHRIYPRAHLTSGVSHSRSDTYKEAPAGAEKAVLVFGAGGEVPQDAEGAQKVHIWHDIGNCWRK